MNDQTRKLLVALSIIRDLDSRMLWKDQVKIAPAMFLLSRAFFHRSSIIIRQYCALKPLRNPQRLEERYISINTLISLYIFLSNIFDTDDRMLTGL